MDLKTTIQRWTLFLGVLQLTVGCVVGFIPPTAVQWYRGLVMAHIEFTANGVLMIALGLLLAHMELGATGLKAWFVTVQTGTWANGAAGLVGAFIGYSSKLMATLNATFPPPNGPDHPAVTGLLMLCGVTIMVALVLTLVGLFRKKPA